MIFHCYSGWHQIPCSFSARNLLGSCADCSFPCALTSFVRHSKKLGCGFAHGLLLVSVAAEDISSVDPPWPRAGKSCGK